MLMVLKRIMISHFVFISILRTSLSLSSINSIRFHPFIKLISPSTLKNRRNKQTGLYHRRDENAFEAEIDEETVLRFQGIGRLFEQQILPEEQDETRSHLQVIHRLQKSTVAIVGIGGVGSWAAESICRSGVGNIILLDLDDVCISNTNRQLHATSKSIGKMKVDVMKERLLDINPSCNVTLIHDFIDEDNVFDIMQKFQRGDTDNNIPKVDVMIDAIDGHIAKASLIAAACIKDVPIVTCGGAAGRIDPTQIVCNDLSQSIECKLLFWTKKKLRNHYRLFPNEDVKKKKNVRTWRIPAVYSLEAIKQVDENSSSSFRKCDGALGTACFVTGTYGMIAASQAVNILINSRKSKPRLLRSSVEYWNNLHREALVASDNDRKTDDITQ
jgi:tRNA A37 threonylcarbamoyladenosine dehydratase